MNHVFYELQKVWGKRLQAWFWIFYLSCTKYVFYIPQEAREKYPYDTRLP